MNTIKTFKKILWKFPFYHFKYEEIINIPQKAKVLDFWCWELWDIKFVKKLRKDLDFHWVDVLIPTIEIPNFMKFNKIQKNEKLPFKDETFDCVVSHHVFEHLDDPYFYISELNRVLKKWGKIIISTPNTSSVLLPGYLNFYAHPDHKRPYNKTSLIWLFNEEDITYHKCKNIRPIPLIFWIPFYIQKKFIEKEDISFLHNIFINNLFRKNILISWYKK